MRTETTTATAPIEPLGGQPAPGSKPSVADLDYQVKYHRAFEAVTWAVPTVALHGFRHGADSVGVKDNDVIAYSKPRRVPRACAVWVLSHLLPHVHGNRRHRSSRGIDTPCRGRHRLAIG
jgi:hypothetical protein